MKDRYQSNSCSKDPPSEMEEGVCREPSSEGRKCPQFHIRWISRQEDRMGGLKRPQFHIRWIWPPRGPVSGRELGTKWKQLCTREASTPREMPSLAWEGAGTARRGIQNRGRPTIRGACMFAAPTTRTVHSPFGETSRIASGSASISHPQHGILHPRFCKWSERYDYNFVFKCYKHVCDDI